MNQHPRQTAKTSREGVSAPQGDGTASEKRLPAGTGMSERSTEYSPTTKEVPLNLFELVKSSVTVKQAAEKYGLPVSHSSMTHCPFHDDHTPSMKLNDTYYYCFGCGAKGDVIDFTAKLFGLSALEAARKLAADFGLDPNTPPAAVVVAAPRRTSEPCDRWFYCQRVLLDYLERLEDWRLRYAPTTPDEPQDERFLEALQMRGWITHLLDLMGTVSADM